MLAPQCILVSINHWITRSALSTPSKEYFLLSGRLWSGLKHGELLNKCILMVDMLASKMHVDTQCVYRGKS